MQGYISARGLAEFYAVLTRAPFTPRVHPAEAGRFLDDNIPYSELIALSQMITRPFLERAQNAGSVGGVALDALHLHSAQRADCDRIYTFNVKILWSLAPSDLADKIAAP